MKKFLKITLSVIIVLFLLIALSPLWYPNVVTQLKPVRNAGEKAKIALGNVAHSSNKDSALVEAVDALPVDGNTLEERVAHWVRYDFNKIDSMKFKLVSGIGISATDAERKVKEGYTRDQVVVQIFSNGSASEYF